MIRVKQKLIYRFQEARIPLTDYQIDQLIYSLDEDGDGEIDFRYLNSMDFVTLKI